MANTNAATVNMNLYNIDKGQGMNLYLESPVTTCRDRLFRSTLTFVSAACAGCVYSMKQSEPIDKLASSSPESCL